MFTLVQKNGKKVEITLMFHCKTVTELTWWGIKRPFTMLSRKMIK